MSDVLWRCERVVLRGTSRPRLQEVNIEIHAGVTAVIGQSGSGKTSLLNLLVGFEKPDSGCVHQTLSRSDAATLPLFWTPQDDGLWPHLTARDHLATVMGAERGAKRDEFIASLLAEFDLAEKSLSCPHELSQGEQSRLSVARALAAGASVLVMDEPLVHVDRTRAWKYWDVIQRRIAATGVSLVFSTHSPRTVLGEADSVIALRDGRVLYQGEVDDLYRRPATLELAECLGEANWLLPAEARLWLEREVAEPCCLRPEQISVVAAERSPIVVESSRFHGAVAEVELRHEATGAQRKFFHRPAANHLRKGDRVLIKALLLVLLLAQLALAGCGQSETSTIPFREARYWSVPPDGAKTPAPRCITVGRNDETIVVDTAGRVLVYDKDGQVKRHWKMPETERGKPEGVCMLSDGRIVVCDTHYHRVFFFDQTGNVLGQFGREGVEPGQFAYPVGVTRDDRDNLYVTEYGGNDRVQKFSRDGQFLLAFGRFGTRPGEFQRPAGLAWHAGKVYVLDAVNNRIQVFTDDGKFLSILGAPDKPLSLRFPFDITLGGDGAFYVIEYGEGRISKLSLDGKLLGRYGRSGGGAGHFTTPWGITVDAKMRLRVADAGNRRIVELNP